MAELGVAPQIATAEAQRPQESQERRENRVGAIGALRRGWDVLQKRAMGAFQKLNSGQSLEVGEADYYTNAQHIRGQIAEVMQANNIADTTTISDDATNFIITRKITSPENSETIKTGIEVQPVIEVLYSKFSALTSMEEFIIKRNNAEEIAEWKKMKEDVLDDIDKIRKNSVSTRELITGEVEGSGSSIPFIDGPIIFNPGSRENAKPYQFQKNPSDRLFPSSSVDTATNGHASIDAVGATTVIATNGQGSVGESTAPVLDVISVSEPTISPSFVAMGGTQAPESTAVDTSLTSNDAGTGVADAAISVEPSESSTESISSSAVTPELVTPTADALVSPEPAPVVSPEPVPSASSIATAAEPMGTITDWEKSSDINDSKYGKVVSAAPEPAGNKKRKWGILGGLFAAGAAGSVLAPGQSAVSPADYATKVDDGRNDRVAYEPGGMPSQQAAAQLVDTRITQATDNAPVFGTPVTGSDDLYPHGPGNRLSVNDAEMDTKPTQNMAYHAATDAINTPTTPVPDTSSGLPQAVIDAVTGGSKDAVPASEPINVPTPTSNQPLQ